MQKDQNGIVLRGLQDATRSQPPQRYDAIAAQHCASVGGKPQLQSKVQRTTFAFDVTYLCKK